MGCGIAEVSARSGMAVTLVEANPVVAEQATASLRRSLERAAERGKLGDVQEVLPHHSHGQPRTARAERPDHGCDRRGGVCPGGPVPAACRVVTRPDAFLASNTSSIG